MVMYGYDKEGHPGVDDQLGTSSIKKLEACFDGPNGTKKHKLKTFRYRMLMRLQNVKRIQSLRYGYDNTVNDKGGLNSITKHCSVMDIKHFQASMLAAKYRNMMRELIEEESNLWPNSLHMMFLVNAPWPFRFSW